MLLPSALTTSYVMRELPEYAHTHLSVNNTSPEQAEEMNKNTLLLRANAQKCTYVYVSNGINKI